ncbi:MAG: hypothetical protein H6716_11830 [Polyangiaceae bacterium]|nr:hypothetical protein [Polyangiaceae bacterium]
MTTTVDQVEREIEAKKADIEDKLERLEDRAVNAAKKGKQALSFDHQMKKRPWVLIAGAVGIGMLLGRKQPQVQAMLVSMPKPKKARQQKQPTASAPHPMLEQGQRLLMTAVLPGVASALARRYAPELLGR